MDTDFISLTEQTGRGIGSAVLCNEQGDPVISVLTPDDAWTLAQLQDAEEEPMLRDLAA